MPGLHARPAPPRLPQRPRRADRGPLGADDRRHAVGRLVHRQVDADDVETCSGPEAGDALSYAAFGDHGTREFFTHVRFHKHERTRRSSSTCSSSSTRARSRRPPRCSRTPPAACSRSPRWPRSHARRPRPATTSTKRPGGLSGFGRVDRRFADAFCLYRTGGSSDSELRAASDLRERHGDCRRVPGPGRRVLRRVPASAQQRRDPADPPQCGDGREGQARHAVRRCAERLGARLARRLRRGGGGRRPGTRRARGANRAARPDGAAGRQRRSRLAGDRRRHARGPHRQPDHAAGSAGASSTPARARPEATSWCFSRPRPATRCSTPAFSA